MGKREARIMPDDIDAIVEAESRAAALAPKPKGIDPVDKSLLDKGSMSRDAAKELTEQIRSMATATYVLVKRAYDYKAWMALGYDSWGAYVTSEFSISRSRSYQLINQAKVIEAISESAPAGTTVTITEAQARDVERALPKITDRVKKETAGQDPEKAGDTIDGIIDDARKKVKADDRRKPDGEDPWDIAMREAVKSGGTVSVNDHRVDDGPTPDTDGMDSASTDGRSRSRSARPNPVREQDDRAEVDDKSVDSEPMSGFDNIGNDVATSVISIGYIFNYFDGLASAKEVAESIDNPQSSYKSAKEAIAWLQEFSSALSSRDDY